MLYPNGYIDFEARQSMVPTFHDILAKGGRKILLNFSGVKKINSMGIAGILELIEQATKSSAVVKYSNLSRMNEKLFKMIGLTEYGTVHESEDEALKEFR
ncbi:MAG: STAS domain-containing protein [Candidatus Schekmanbacteria bacterium]|nr:STAS domain-containing protein [Candidatus Schekmanbacteria bacterium]